MHTPKIWSLQHSRPPPKYPLLMNGRFEPSLSLHKMNSINTIWGRDWRKLVGGNFQFRFRADILHQMPASWGRSECHQYIPLTVNSISEVLGKKKKKTINKCIWCKHDSKKILLRVVYIGIWLWKHLGQVAPMEKLLEPSTAFNWEY